MHGATTSGYACPTTGTPTDFPTRTLTWAEPFGAIEMTLRQYAFPWSCNRAGDDVTCTTGDTLSSGTDRQITYRRTFALPGVDDGASVVTLTTTATCVGTGCAPMFYCPSAVATWTASKD